MIKTGNPMAKKFDGQDRQKVVSRLEQRDGTRLYPIGSRQKYRRDDDGNRYVVLGGCGHFHGIPSEIMELELAEPSEAKLVIAIRKKSTIVCYVGMFGILASRRSLLSRDKKGDYKFNVAERNGRLFIEQIPLASLSELFTIPYSNIQKADDREGFVQKRQLAKEFSKLTDSEKKELLASLLKERVSSFPSNPG